MKKWVNLQRRRWQQLLKKPFYHLLQDFCSQAALSYPSCKASLLLACFMKTSSFFTDKAHFSSQVKEDPRKEKSTERKIWERTWAAEGCWWGPGTSQSLSRGEGRGPSVWVTQHRCLGSRGPRTPNVHLQYNSGRVASIILMWLLSWCINLELNGLWISPGRLEIWELAGSVGGKGETNQVL